MRTHISKPAINAVVAEVRRQRCEVRRYFPETPRHPAGAPRLAGKALAFVQNDGLPKTGATPANDPFSFSLPQRSANVSAFCRWNIAGIAIRPVAIAFCLRLYHKRLEEKVNRSRVLFMGLVLGIAATFASKIQADVLQPASGAGTFGNPYAYFGLDGRKSWEVYRKMNGNAVVTATTAAGNGTLAEFTNQYLGDAPPAGFNFTGEIFLGKTQATTPATYQFYLRDVTI